MSNRKYEIAENETMGIFDQHELDITGLSNAMDIYAKEVAIEFAEWCDNNYYSIDGSVGTENISFKEAYELFLQSQKQ